MHQCSNVAPQRPAVTDKPLRAYMIEKKPVVIALESHTEMVIQTNRYGKVFVVFREKGQDFSKLRDVQTLYPNMGKNVKKTTVSGNLGEWFRHPLPGGVT